MVLVQTCDVSLRPAFRGRLHQGCAFVMPVAAVALVAAASTFVAAVAAAIYGAGMTVMFSASALYHRLNHRSLTRRRWFQRVDHAAIHLAMAASYVPLCLVGIPLQWGIPLLAVAAFGAGVGAVAALVGRHRLSQVLYLPVGWVAILATPVLALHAGLGPTILLSAGGIVYTVGAVMFARRFPHIDSTTWSYHEVFHALTLVAAALQYWALFELVTA